MGRPAPYTKNDRDLPYRLSTAEQEQLRDHAKALSDHLPASSKKSLDATIFDHVLADHYETVTVSPDYTFSLPGKMQNDLLDAMKHAYHLVDPLPKTFEQYFAEKLDENRRRYRDGEDFGEECSYLTIDPRRYPDLDRYRAGIVERVMYPDIAGQ